MARAVITLEVEYDLDTEEGYMNQDGKMVHDPFDMLNVDITSISDIGLYDFVDNISLMEDVSVKLIKYMVRI
jgi:hypothetical protein